MCRLHNLPCTIYAWPFTLYFEYFRISFRSNMIKPHYYLQTLLELLNLDSYKFVITFSHVIIKILKMTSISLFEYLNFFGNLN